MAFFPNKPDNAFAGLDWHPVVLTMIPPIPINVWIASALHVGDGLLGNPVTTDMTNSDVLADGQPILSRGHAARGMFHGNVPPIIPWPPGGFFPLSLLIPVLYGVSSHQCSFACYSVTAPLGPVAVSTCVFPLLSCQTFGMAPTTLVYNNGSVQIGVSAGDVVASLFQSAVDAAISYVAGEIAGAATAELDLGNAALTNAATEALEAVLGFQVDNGLGESLSEGVNDTASELAAWVDGTSTDVGSSGVGSW